MAGKTWRVNDWLITITLKLSFTMNEKMECEK
jgi:hypothetical protein